MILGRQIACHYLTMKKGSYRSSELDDETMYYDAWLALGVPDEATDDDLRYIAENDDDFYDICDLFMRLYNAED